VSDLLGTLKTIIGGTKMKKIEFVSLNECIAYAKQFGGWIFYNKDDNQAIWYDASLYTMTDVLKDSPCHGTISGWKNYV
jgi:hypothetical protein